MGVGPRTPVEDGVLDASRSATPEQFKIGRVLHLKSEIPKSLIELTNRIPIYFANHEDASNLRFRDLGFEMQDSSDFEMHFCEIGIVKAIPAEYQTL